MRRVVGSWSLLPLLGSLACSPGDDPADEDDQASRSEPARGIRISRVEANPGVSVPIVIDREWVDGRGRNAAIPAERNTAFRVSVEVDDDWVEREILGVLTVTSPGGDASEYEVTTNIRDSSPASGLHSTMLFGVLGEDMVPGAELQVELYEAGGDFEDFPAEDEPPDATDEPVLIGVESAYLNMRVVMVPIEYSFGGCERSVDLDDPDVIRPYEDALYQHNPLSSLEIEIHEPLRVDDLDLGGEGFFDLLTRIQRLRSEEDPDPYVYYYGLFDNCGVCIGGGSSQANCVLGVAPGESRPSIADAGRRAAIGAQFLSGREIGPDTFVHEIGHAQGRKHVECASRTASNPDRTYPHEGGSIGVWGFGVRDFQVRSPTTHTDYMSYCQPTWVSDWQWNATFLRIRELSEWETSRAEPVGRQGILTGTVDPTTGASSWWTENGVFPADPIPSEWTFEFTTTAGEVRRRVAEVFAWDEGSRMTVRAPLPEGFDDEVDEITLHTPDRAIVIDRVHLDQYHEVDRLRARVP